MRLKGRVAWITGGGRGIGAAIALAFADEGADVAVSSRTASEIASVAKQVQAKGRRGLSVWADVGDRRSVDAAVTEILGTLGRIDILVNNAALYGAQPVTDVSEKSWGEVLDVNLSGPFRCAQAVLPQMIARGSGRIINIGSIHGLVGDAHAAAQCASKFGLTGLTLSMAETLRPKGIAVNIVCPGAVAKADPAVNPLSAKVPPENVARLCVFLASDEAASMTGSVVTISGTTHAPISLKP